MMAKVEDFYNAVADDYHRIYELGSEPSYRNGIGDYFRLQIVLRLLAAARARSVFEVGVGDGTPLKHMHLMGLQVAGCDIASNMVDVARAKLTDAGVAEPKIWRADICNAVELASAMLAEPSDSVVALGVMPHVEKDVLALKNMRTLVRTGGKLLIEFRNSLFSLFTFNRYTHDFVVDELLQTASEETRAVVSKTLKELVRMDLPPVRDRAPNSLAPGYDLIPAKFHNPFQIPELLERAGFISPVFHWYHFHAAMPMLQAELGPRFDEDSIAMEHELSNDWRGYFLCSAVLVEANAG
jgi:2-polyprenyl-3-methyl-5-hydroxy-6-metoxy-1,4-benzoquinol methylase